MRQTSTYAAFLVCGSWGLTTSISAPTPQPSSPESPPLDDVLGSDDPFPADEVGRPVTVSGRYLSEEQLYVDGLAGADAR